MKALTAVDSSDGFEHWHHVTCRQFSTTQCRSIVERNFQARITAREFGALKIHNYLSTTPPDDLITVSRRQPDIRTDHRDHFQLWVMLDGRTSLAQQGRAVQIGAGDIMLQDQSLPFDLELGHLAHAHMVLIPRSLIASRLSTTNHLAARKIVGSSKIGILIGSLVRQLTALDEIKDDRVERRLAASLLDVIAAAIEADSDQENISSRRESILKEAKQYIIDNLQNCDLNLETISNAQNIAPRTLNRLFAAEGTTPIRWLWQQRLAASYSALCEGRVATVTDAALDFGFKDVSHFSRTFKSFYGVTPRSVAGRSSR